MPTLKNNISMHLVVPVNGGDYTQNAVKGSLSCRLARLMKPKENSLP